MSDCSGALLPLRRAPQRVSVRPFDARSVSFHQKARPCGCVGRQTGGDSGSFLKIDGMLKNGDMNQGRKSRKTTLLGTIGRASRGAFGCAAKSARQRRALLTNFCGTSGDVRRESRQTSGRPTVLARSGASRTFTSDRRATFADRVMRGRSPAGAVRDSVRTSGPISSRGSSCLTWNSVRDRPPKDGAARKAVEQAWPWASTLALTK